MQSFAISMSLITGFMVGIEVPEQKMFVMDLGIVRLIFDWGFEDE